MTETQNRRPGTNGTAAKNAERFDALTLADLDDLALRLHGTFVVVVERRDADELRILRRPYLTAKAAERAARNAQQRGQRARVYLAELRPMFHLQATADEHDQDNRLDVAPGRAEVVDPLTGELVTGAAASGLGGESAWLTGPAS